MQIRPATPADIPHLVRMRDALRTTYSEVRAEDHPEWPERAAAAYRTLLPRDTHLFLVAEDADGRVVGGMSARLDLGIPGPTYSGVNASIHDTWVDEDQRGHGIARALMDAALEWCRKNECRNVKLHSTPMAVGAYEKMGFHVGVAKPGDEKFPVMWLDF